MDISLTADELALTREDRDALRAEKEARDGPSYFSREHQNSKSYFRIENWYPDVADHTFATSFIDLSALEALALTKGQEEVQLRAAIRDQEKQIELEEQGNPSKTFTAALDDPEYNEEIYTFIRTDWPNFTESNEWEQALQRLETKIDQVLSTEFAETGAMVKLSVRSPKDTANILFETRRITKELMRAQPQAEPAGAQAVKLLLLSNRIATDLRSYDLYREENEEFCIKVALREWRQDIDPSWEFRTFIFNDQMTAITIYSPWVYDEDLWQTKNIIQQKIMNTWHSVKDAIAMNVHDYSIDFAFDEAHEDCYVIEINYRPPIAGTALFDWGLEADRRIVMEGPFEFRLHEHPFADYDREIVSNRIQIPSAKKTKSTEESDENLTEEQTNIVKNREETEASRAIQTVHGPFRKFMEETRIELWMETHPEWTPPTPPSATDEQTEEGGDNANATILDNCVLM